MKRKCVVVLAILVLMQVLCGVQSAPKAQTAGEKKPTILVESKNFFKNNPITEIYEYLYGECPVEFVALPSNGAEREAMIEEIRAEIEASGGPDAFILAAHARTRLVRPRFSRMWSRVWQTAHFCRLIPTSKAASILTRAHRCSRCLLPAR